MKIPSCQFRSKKQEVHPGRLNLSTVNAELSDRITRKCCFIRLNLIKCTALLTRMLKFLFETSKKGLEMNESILYTLDEEGNPISVSTENISYYYPISDKKRIIGRTQIGPIVVSTVFLGVNHNIGGEGGPILFETMCFDERDDMPVDMKFDLMEHQKASIVIFGEDIFGNCKRYHTIKDALEGHNQTVKTLCDAYKDEVPIELFHSVWKEKLSS